MATLSYSAPSVVSGSSTAGAASLLARIARAIPAFFRAWNDRIIDRRIARYLATNGGVMSDDMERQLGWVADGVPVATRRDLDTLTVSVMMLRS